MSLYGLDILVDRDDRFRLLEINGVRSGMRGFRQVYGDDRVEWDVYKRLWCKHGFITQNSPEARRLRVTREHPMQAVVARVLEPFHHFYRWVRPAKPAAVLRSPKADVGWLDEHAGDSSRVDPPFEPYLGQDSTVFNIVNERLPHPLVNPLVAEAVADNKFLTYQVLRGTELEETLPFTVLVGLGLGDPERLKRLRGLGSRFVRKPLLGCQGAGVSEVGPEAIERYVREKGGFYDPQVSLAGVLKRTILDAPRTVEEMLQARDFTFEYGLSILQPLVEGSDPARQRVIRAIVCNGGFVDAYARVGERIPVNLARGARAEPVDRKGALGEFAESVVDVFERQCASYDCGSFRTALYGEYGLNVGPWAQKMESQVEWIVSQIGAIALEKWTGDNAEWCDVDGGLKDAVGLLVKFAHETGAVVVAERTHKKTINHGARRG